ncbi:hypothetical protein OIU85_013268 [Salix viminalis]|uniref:Uncharacterized protein n=1 Tax=Salix viminalis TaxID=40686 RepID=A0A9Q0NLH1_SALVM|nr:hypothetical protein OIU85_013268 [Salix viminalis]
MGHIQRLTAAHTPRPTAAAAAAHELKKEKHQYRKTQRYQQWIKSHFNTIQSTLQHSLDISGGMGGVVGWVSSRTSKENPRNTPGTCRKRTLVLCVLGASGSVCQCMFKWKYSVKRSVSHPSPASASDSEAETFPRMHC